MAINIRISGTLAIAAVVLGVADQDQASWARKGPGIGRSELQRAVGLWWP
jgi:hypothetical protein